MTFTIARRILWAAITILFVTGFALLWHLCASKLSINFLSKHGGAEWIIYPKSPDLFAETDYELSTQFRRSFQLEQVHGNAKLAIRAFERFELTVNGKPVAPPTASNWKDATEFDMTGLLHLGTNEISVLVYNKKAPPALWLSLDTGQDRITTGPDWEASLMGAVWRPAWLASVPLQITKGNAIFGGENTKDSLCKSLPALLLFGVISCGIVFAGFRFLRRRISQADGDTTRAWSQFMMRTLATAVILWVALFANNLRSLSRENGYDQSAHWAYISYICDHKALPLANEGWEMCQPPLYYAISAGITTASGTKPASDRATSMVRLFGLITGIAHFTLIFLCLRLLFPGCLGAQWFGVILAAFVPEHLYISQYVTNEFLAALLVTAALYFCLRLLKEEQESSKLALGVGLCLGAALLTKFTAILATPFIGAVLIHRLYSGNASAVSPRFRTFGVVALVAFAVAGWHYIRVWIHFGTPVVHDWDPESGFSWWADKGFQTTKYFTGFGESLVHPYYSVVHSFGDGIYSSLWGDAFYGGMSSWENRPPWNYQLMTAGFVLALLPTAIILLGFARCVVKFLQQPEPVWFVLLGLAVTTYTSLAYMSLKLPYYCNVKAFYALLTFLPMCAFGAAGWELLMRIAGRLRPLLYVAISVWAINAYVSFWIRPGRAATHALRGNYLSYEGRSQDAINELTEALRIDPHNVLARRFLATERAKTDVDGAWQETKKLLADDPDDAPGLLQAALLLARNGQMDEAIRDARRAVEVAPDYALGYEELSTWLAQTGKFREAEQAAREGLRITPLSPDMHFELAAALSNLGQDADAIGHLQIACGLKPNWPEAHYRLGLLLAKLNRWDDAVNEFSAACKLLPDNPDYRTQLKEASQHTTKAEPQTHGAQ